MEEAGKLYRLLSDLIAARQEENDLAEDLARLMSRLHEVRTKVADLDVRIRSLALQGHPEGAYQVGTHVVVVDMTRGVIKILPLMIISRPARSCREDDYE